MLDYINSRSDVFEAVTDACVYFLKKSPEAELCRNYIDSRISKDLQNKYCIGYFPSSNNLSALIDIVGRKYLEQFSIIYYRNSNNGSLIQGHFSEHNMVMPFKNVHGDVVSLLGRSILSENEQKDKQIQKYKYSINADKELYVYGLDIAKQSIINKNYVICVEGQFDCISCHKNGIDNVVALGWSTLSRYQLYQLSKYTNNIVLLLDNDEAGIKGQAIAKKRFGKIINIKTMKPPAGYKDIDEFFMSESSEKKKLDAINFMKNLI